MGLRIWDLQFWGQVLSDEIRVSHHFRVDGVAFSCLGFRVWVFRGQRFRDDASKCRGNCSGPTFRDFLMSSSKGRG